MLYRRVESDDRKAFSNLELQACKCGVYTRTVYSMHDPNWDINLSTIRVNPDPREDGELEITDWSHGIILVRKRATLDPWDHDPNALYVQRHRCVSRDFIAEIARLMP